MRNWCDIRRQARITRALVDPHGIGMAGEDVLAALTTLWCIQVAPYPADSPLLSGARASWRGRLRLLAVDSALSPVERVFPLAHELGHFVCHQGRYDCHSADIDDAVMPVAVPLGEGRVWGYNPRQARELEANIFAAELLAPANELRARFLDGAGYQVLARLYGVTPSCVLNQLLAAVLGGADVLATDTTTPPPPLDLRQREAAESTGRRVLVEAGPGTGKTHTLGGRVAHLLSRSDVSAHQILILTFSNRAADELRERLRGTLPGAASVTVATFHGFGLDTLRRFASEASLPDDVRVIDDTDAALLLQRALATLKLRHYKHLSWPGRYLPGIVDTCSRMRDELMTLDHLATSIATACTASTEAEIRERLEETHDLIAAYEGLLAAEGLVDYGGLIHRTVDLLRENSRVATALRRQYRHILVDEYQDVNRASAVLLQELAASADSLWVVGDVRQAIYRFRGATPENMIRFDEDFPGATHFTLEVNYRAVPSIVATLMTAASAMTGTRPTWIADRSECHGGGILLATAPDGASEIAGIVQDIQQSLVGGRAADDHAVLCSTHAQAVEVAAALEKAGLPTSYLGNFFLRPEIKDMLALLDLCSGPDGTALLRLGTWPGYALDEQRVEGMVRSAHDAAVPFPLALRHDSALGSLSPQEREALNRLSEHIEAVRYYRDPAAILLHYLFGDAPYLRTLLRDDSVRGRQTAAAIFQMVVLARGFSARPPVLIGDDAVHAFLGYVWHLLAQGENSIYQATAAVPGAINVLTAHASKGNEFPVVYIPNLGRGRFPVHGSDRTKVERPLALQPDHVHRDDDDRRLFFVAMSRARDRLVLSRARRYGQRNSNPAGVLDLINGMSSLGMVEWPAIAKCSTHTQDLAVANDTEDEATVGEVAERAADVDGRDVAAIMRCPRQYYYRAHLGLSGGRGAEEYALFTHVVRQGIRWIRMARSTQAWPATWSAAEVVLMAQWSAAWSEPLSLAAYYQAEALQIYRAEYERLQSADALAGVQFGQSCVVSVEGTSVAMHVDVVEEKDGQIRYIWERVTKKSDDARSITAALYTLVVETSGKGRPASAHIRYFDSVDMQLIEQGPAVLEQHRPRLATTLRAVRTGQYPPQPGKAEYCLRCPYVIICPRPPR